MRPDRDDSMSLGNAFEGWSPGAGSSVTGESIPERPSGPAVGYGADHWWEPPRGVEDDDPLDVPSDSPDPISGLDVEQDIHGGENPWESNGVPAKRKFPKIGETIGGFRLRGELGRGTFARVYLAEQIDLGRRKVALKVSPPRGEEPLRLARLQHTHIVPIHSVSDDPETGLRLLCMPYLGGANLAEILGASRGDAPAQSTGHSLIAALDGVVERLEPAERPSPRERSASSLSGQLPPSLTDSIALDGSRRRSMLARWFDRLHERRGLPSTPPAPAEAEQGQPARRFFRRSTYLQSAVWIVARLAEALEHAHGRGLLHRDLKPSNVLIAADGTPMLLDFNLSADSQDDEPTELGGTLPYMAPEQLEAFHPDSDRPNRAVDERSDLYSLGLILYEAIVGHTPFDEPPSHWPIRDAIAAMIATREKGAPSARAANPAVPWSLDSILKVCLDPDPARRYQHAGALAEDLRRFLDDQPLATAPEPSIRERAQKWLRRHPKFSSATGIGSIAAVLLFLTLSVIGALTFGIGEMRAASMVRHFNERFREAQFYLETASGPDDRNHRLRGFQAAREAFQIVGGEPDDHWSERANIQRLPRAQERSLRNRVIELCMALSEAEYREAIALSRPEAVKTVLRSAIRRLDAAERIGDDLPGAFYLGRADLLEELGESERAQADRDEAGRRPPGDSAWDQQLEGVRWMRLGRPDEAESWFKRAIIRDPRDYWSAFMLGFCQVQLGKDERALGNFQLCAALMPDFAWSYANLGLVQTRLGEFEEARASFDRALELESDLVVTLINRGRLLLDQGDSEGAARDLSRVIQLGEGDPAVLAAYAEALAMRKQAEQSARVIEEADRQFPGHPAIDLVIAYRKLGSQPELARARFERVVAGGPSEWLGRAHLGLAYLDEWTDPPSAIAHLDQALAAEPRLGKALELRAILRARRGDRGALDDTNRLLRESSKERLYNAACVDALLAYDDTSRIRPALDRLERAIRRGFPAAEAAKDPDLDALRASPDFERILRNAPQEP